MLKDIHNTQKYLYKNYINLKPVNIYKTNMII